MWLLCSLVLVSALSVSEILSERNPVPEDDRIMDYQGWDGRIVGGEEANITDYPHQVTYLIDNKSICGGFIVSKDYILTAGHCAKGVDPSTIVLRAGSSFRKNGTIIPIVEVVTHPEFDHPRFDKDVAYMKTGKPIKFSDTMKPIALPAINRSLTGEIEVSGWGRLVHGSGNPYPNRLMRVKLPVVSRTLCLTSYPRLLTRNMVCAGNYALGGIGTCQGDSGGAAIQNGTAVGIVSFATRCAEPLAPTVFANIASPAIRNFITKNTGL